MFDGLTSLKELRLNQNSIGDIEAQSFIYLAECTELYLDRNNLTHIQTRMFDGLLSLTTLDLDVNKISKIEPGSFAKLTKLNFVWLNNNLTLLMANNPFQCDYRMCWIKHAEQVRRITLIYNRLWGTSYDKPHCANYQGVAWNDIELDCNTRGKQLDFQRLTRNIFQSFLLSGYRIKF